MTADLGLAIPSEAIGSLAGFVRGNADWYWIHSRDNWPAPGRSRGSSGRTVGKGTGGRSGRQAGLIKMLALSWLSTSLVPPLDKRGISQQRAGWSTDSLAHLASQSGA